MIDQLNGGTDESWVHLDESESAESAKRTLSGHDENEEALLYRCMLLWGETDYVSSYDRC